jgi:molybdopterin/thiamine biosynthesis adenylyltransferase
MCDPAATDWPILGERGTLCRVLSFNYHEAFGRNLGWVTEAEQRALRGKRIAIAGLGGVGGTHLLTLVRLGIGAFSIADPDRFDLANFNRQVGATMPALGRSKVEVLAAMAREINPELDIRTFDEGVTAGNLTDFLEGANVYVDGLDFFAFSARERTFAACAAKGIPAVTVAPIGMGAALLNFIPGRMTFEQYFRFKDASDTEKALRFLLGLAPAMLHRRYLVDLSRVNLREQRGPSTMMACQLCAGVAATEVLKLLLDRGPLLAAPWGLQFDAYTNRLARTWRPWGNANPLQRVALAIAKRQLEA